jgi:A/G-specific adenine glycosylase
MHAGAREVMSRHGGRVPEDRDARLALPGIGRYTAGAIGSIAFDRPEPIVDGNVARVLSRVHAIAAPAADARFWTEAERLAHGPRPGALNQAMMELGATVCTPRTPACEVCPIARACVARREDRVGELPPPRVRRTPRVVRLVAVVARNRSGDAWMTRTEGTLFGGLWAVPTAEGHGREAARAALEAAGVRARLAPRAVSRLEHVLTHRRLDVEVWRATAPRASASRGRRAVSHAALAHLGTSTLTRRILAT